MSFWLAWKLGYHSAVLWYFGLSFVVCMMLLIIMAQIDKDRYK